MSTATVTPAPAVVITPLSWFQKHERLLIVLMIVCLGAWLIQRHYNVAAQDATTRATIAEAKAASADTSAAQSAVVLQQAIQQVNVENATLAAQNAALAQALTARQTATVVQQRTDSALTQSALSSRIATLSSAPPAEVTFDDANVRLGRNAAVAVAQSLELVPTLQANLADETNIAKNTQSELDGANGLIIKQSTDITALGIARTADAVSCQAELKQVKAASRANSMKWFKRGFITGNVTGFLGGLWAAAHGL